MHINYAQSEDLLESLITDVLEQNDGLCMDNEKERMALAQALVFHLTGKAVDLHATGRCITCGVKLQTPENVRCPTCFGWDEE